MSRYLKWDGRCFDDALTADPAGWCNADVKPQPPVKPPVGMLLSALGPQSGVGVSASAQRAEVTVISVDEAFAPIEEFAVIEIEFKQIEKAGCLVVQIRDSADKLVYAERLTRDQIGGLPERMVAVSGAKPPLAVGSGAMDRPTRAARAALRWANPAASPYRVTCWLTNKVCADATLATELALDVSVEDLASADYVARSTTKVSPLANLRPIPEADQTTVRFAGELGVEVVPWAELYPELADVDAYPLAHLDVDAIPDRPKKVMWVKCRLNELGFYAGPIDDDEANVDFLKAVRRYGAMRAIDGKRPYKVNLDKQTGLPDYDETNEKLPGAQPGFDKLAGLEPDGYPLASLLEHLKREKKLAREPLIPRPNEIAARWTSEPVKIPLEANRYYIMANETDDIGKGKAEAAWFSRPSLPVRARALIRARFDLATPMFLPEVMRECRFTWSWTAPDENHALLPDPAAPTLMEASDFNYGAESRDAYADARLRSKTRPYIVAAKGPSPNARASVGGILTGVELDDYHVVFGAFLRAVPFEKDDGTKTVTSIGPAIYFRPSNIAGDTYQLSVAFDPERQKTAAGVALSGTQKDNLAKLNALDKLAARTRKLVGWRKLRIAAFVNWPDQEGKKTWDGKSSFALDTILKGMQKEFSYAYIDIGPSQPGAKSLRRLKPSEIKLDPTDQAAPGTLLHSGLVVQYPSMEACIDDFLATKAVPLRGGRTTYLIPGQGPEPDRFSDRAVLPRLEVRAIVVDTAHHMDPVPAGGVLPSVSRVVDFILQPKLNALLKNAKTNYVNAISPFAEAQAALFDVWQLVNEWKQTPASVPGEPPAMAQIRGAVRAAGAWYATQLSALTRISPGPQTPVPLPRAGKVAKDQNFWQWADPSVAPPTLQYVEAAVLAYDEEHFPALLNLLLLPEGGARHELKLWAAGGTLPDRKALRTASVYNLLANGAHTQPGLDSPDFFTFDAIKHYMTWLPSILETLPTGKKYCDAGVMKDIPAASRKLTAYEGRPTVAESMILENAVGGSMTALGNTWSVPFDEIVRKGLCCRRDGDGDYQDFADGMIIINALVNEAVELGGRPYIVAGTSVGSPLGLVFVCQTTAMEPYALFSHELAHVLFLDHFQNAKGLIYDHDHSDLNCAMAYPLIEIKDAEAMASLTPGQTSILDGLRARLTALWDVAWQTLQLPDKVKAGQTRVEIGNIDRHNLSRVYRPHFCGKCNLKLRGWDILADAGAVNVLPLHSSTPFPQLPPFAAAAPPPRALPPRVGAPTIRLVHGGPDGGASGEAVMASIPISYFPSTLTHKAGGTFPIAPVSKGNFKLSWLVPFPAGFGHDPDALTDPAVFKVEVVDPNCHDTSLWAEVEALLPTYDPSGKAVSWAPFGGAERDRRMLKIECRALPGDPHRFRSRYLRLVTDEADKNGLGPTAQGLLVTDTANGDGGAEDTVEILDQKVRASYTDGAATLVNAESKVGDPSRTRKRIKLFFHLFKHPTVGDDDLKKQARRRAMRWARRAFAQADMSVKVLGFEILEWPTTNMLTINGFSRADYTTNAPVTSGTDGANPSTLTLTLGSDDGTGKVVTPLVVPLTAGLDAMGIGQLVARAVAALDPSWGAMRCRVPPTDQPLLESCDVVLARDGCKVTIDAVATTDTALPAWVLEIPNPDIGLLSDDDTTVGGSPSQRSILRAGASADDRVDVYVVPKMGIAGRAYPSYSTVRAARFHPDPGVRRAVIMAYDSAGKKAMDGGDETPFTLAHEIGHVLVDTGHNEGQGDLMQGVACLVNRVDSPKRIYSGPLKVGFEDMNQLDAAAQIFVTDADMYARMQAAGAPAVTELWP